MSASMNNPSAVFNVNGTVGAAKFLNRSGIRIAAYWLFTLLVVFENAAGFVWAFLHIEYLRARNAFDARVRQNSLADRVSCRQCYGASRGRVRVISCDAASAW